MNKINRLIAIILISSISLYSQVGFTEKSNVILNGEKIYTSLSIAVSDINGDYYDDITVLDQGIYLKTYQNTGNLKFFKKDSIGKTFNKPAWTINTGDFNNDDISEIYTCGAQTFGQLYSYNDTTYTLTDELRNVSYAQNSNIVDINNDGFLDLFVCNENNYNAIYINDKTGNLIWKDFINFKVDSNYNNYGDYGSDFIDFDDDGDVDLFITKCWPGASEPNDPRRVNTLFINDGNNNFTNQAKKFGLNSGAQSWTGMFGDMDNDGDLDCFVTNHDTMHYYYENINNDTFIMKTGISFPILNCGSIQASLRDFDNNGFLDILISGDKSFLVWNYGNNNFSVVEDPFDRGVIHSFAIGDLNNDGFLDIYSSYGKGLNEFGNYKDLIWINNKNDNHFVKFSLYGTESNRQGIGTKIKIYGKWGVQTRDSRIGESYGISNSINLNFGLNDAKKIDSMVIIWPSGLKDKYYNIKVDKHYLLQEGMDINDFFDIELSGNAKFCTGDSVILKAPYQNDYSYLWSNGKTTKDIVVNNSGSFNVTITNSFGVKQISKIIVTEINPIEKPEINFTEGYFAICKDEKVTIEPSLDFYSYQWFRDGNIIQNESNKTLNINSSGDYYLKALGTCEEHISDTISVTFVEATNPQVEYQDTVHQKKSITITAKGNKILWYDSQSSNSPLDTGFTFITDIIDSYKVYWAENIDEYIFKSKYIGLKDNSMKQTGSLSTNGGLKFDCHKEMILKSIKVYSDLDGIRRFQLKDDEGNILSFKDTLIGVGTHIINLNFKIYPGINYKLETDKIINLSSFLTEAPHLYRDNGKIINYPYVNDLMTINESYFGRNYYYYFYDWEVTESGLECASDRIAIPIVYDPESAINDIKQNSILLFPNPVLNKLQITSENVINKIAIYNSLGEKVIDKHFNNTNSIQQNIKSLNQGIYFIRIIGYDIDCLKRFVKSH